MRLGNYLSILVTKLLAIVISMFVVLLLIAELSGRGPGDRPMTQTEILFLALSIPGIWLGYFLVRWWISFVDEQGG